MLLLNPIDSSKKQSLEELELQAMEIDQIKDCQDREKYEDESEDEDDDDEDDEQGAYYDSPWPSDGESEDEEYIVTSAINDASIRSENESVVPVAELSSQLQELKTGSLSPVRLLETSTPTPPCEPDHCGCIQCTTCTDCGVCKDCLICFTCGDCKYETMKTKSSDSSLVFDYQVMVQESIKEVSSVDDKAVINEVEVDENDGDKIGDKNGDKINELKLGK